MGKLFKVLIVFIVIIAAVAAGLSIFIRVYLTEERLKAMILPQAEKALGRKVEIGAIKVSLLKGITVNDFAIKEKDGKSDFVKTTEFVLHYDLMPLLQKKIVVSQIKLISPEIQVVRRKNGIFNYEGLEFLKAKEKKEPETTPSAGEAAAVPLALTIDSVVVKDARVHFKDELNELPLIDAKADCSLSLDMGPDMRSMLYSGTSRFSADVKYGKVASSITGSAKFDNNQAAFDIVTKVDGQSFRLAGDVKNYLKSPDAHIDISSDELDIDKLMALAAVLPASKGKDTRQETGSSTKPGQTLPPGLKIEGKVAIGRILYRPYEIDSFGFKYLLKDGKVFVQDISAQFKGDDIKGMIGAHGSADLNAMVGSLTLESLNVDLKGIKAQVTGKAGLDPQKIDLNFTAELDGQKARVEGEIKNYDKAPDIKLDIASDEIDVNKLLALSAVLPKSQEKSASKPQKAPTKKAESEAIDLPKGLKARGTVRVARLLYDQMVINDLLLKYRLKDGILFVDEFSAKTADGYVASRAEAQLTKKRIPFKGDLKVKGVNLPKLLQGLKSSMAGKLSGILGAEFNFSGTGTRWDYLQKSLNVEGKYVLRDGKIKGVKAVSSIADLLGLPSLKNVDFKNLDGTVHVSHGKVQLKTIMSGKEVSARAKGVIGLDGSLDLPLTLILSKNLSNKLAKKSSYAKYLINKEGKTELNIKLAGSVKSPRPALDTSAVKKKVKKEVKKRVVKELGKFLNKSKGTTGEEPGSQKATPGNLLKGLLGK